MVFLAACGGGAQATTAGSSPKPEGAAIAGDSGGEAPSQPGPVMSVYVRGPVPHVATEGQPSYATEVVVTNTGDTRLDVRRARARVEAWTGDRVTPCGEAELTGPEALEPGSAHTYRIVAACDLATLEDHEIRAYVELAGGQGDFERVTHHVARTPAGR